MIAPLLHVVRSLDPAAGGPPELVRQLSLAHAELGVPVEIATLDAPDAPWLRDWPTPVTAFGGHAKYGWTPRLGPWLATEAARFSSAFVHGLWQWQGAGTWLALQGKRLPYFVFPHGMLDPWFRDAWPLRHARKAVYWRAFEQRVLRRAAGVIFTCEEERRLGRGTFSPWTARREFVVPLGTVKPPGKASELRADFLEKFPALRGERLLLFLGRLHPKKGCDLLLEAFREVPSPLHLVFAGPCDDPLFAQKLRDQSQGLRVTFTGPLYGLEKWSALAAAEAFILPSHQENFGIAVAEALASGVPVLISNRVNIWREIIDAGAGLAENDDLAGTKRLLVRWLDVDAERFRMAAQLCFATKFDIKNSAEHLARLASTF